MENFIQIFNNYARSELLILVPVLYIISQFLISSKVKNEKIPIIISIISIVLSAIYTLSIVSVISISTFLLAIFTSVTQGVLFAGATILGGILFNPKIVIKHEDEETQNNK